MAFHLSWKKIAEMANEEDGPKYVIKKKDLGFEDKAEYIGAQAVSSQQSEPQNQQQMNANSIQYKSGADQPLKKQKTLITIKAQPNKIFDGYRLSRGKVDISRYFLDPDELARHEAKLKK